MFGPGLKVSIDIARANVWLYNRYAGTQNILAAQQSVPTGVSNTVAGIAIVGALLAAILTAGAGVFLISGAGGVVTVTAYTGGKVSIVIGALGAGGVGTLGVISTTNAAIVSAALALLPSAIPGLGLAIVGVAGTSAAVLTGVVALGLSATTAAGIVWGLQQTADGAEYGFAVPRLTALGSVDVDLGSGGSSWTNVPGFSSLFQGHIVTTSSGEVGTSWYRCHLGIPPAAQRPESYNDAYSTWKTEADELRELRRIKEVSPAPPADIDAQITAQEKVLDDTSITFLEEQNNIWGTRVYQNFQAANGSEFDRLVRLFPNESVSITKFKDTFIAIRGGRLAEVRLGSIGSNDIIADFTTEYTTLDSGRGILFEGAPPITSDDDRYIYFIGSFRTGTTGEFEESLWRIELTNLELPSKHTQPVSYTHLTLPTKRIV